MVYRDDVEDALFDALYQFDLGPYVDGVMDSLDTVIEWDEYDDEDEDDSGSVVWI